MGKSIDSGIRQAWIHIPSLQLISNVNLASHVTLLILFFLSVRWEYSGCLVGFLWELNEIHSYKDLKSGPVVAVQSLGCVQLFVAPWTAACQASLSFTVSEFAQIHESVMLFNHLILCHPLLLLPSIFPSIRVFSSELALHIRWPKYWSFSFSISPSNE